ncbi:hypothetical protein TNCV_4911591 [Trichonephila clavipes]|nr:hypothetical protein TNCV_4911591 [Trichonephila clavipes]
MLPKILSEYPQSACSLNQWIWKSCGLNHECRGLENSSLPLSIHGKIVEVVPPSIVSSRNFAKLIRIAACMVLKANDKRTFNPLPR